MTHYFFDTSGLAKRYHVEAGSADVDRLFQSRPAMFHFSQLGMVEARSAFATKVRLGELSNEQAEYLHSLLVHDIRFGRIRHHAMKSPHYSSGLLLLQKYSAKRRLRTLDALQLAVAMDLSAQGLLNVFVTADKLLAEVARGEGLHVYIPTA